MSQRRNIAAFTAPGGAPAFISINREADGTVTVHVRSSATDGQYYGGQAAVTLQPGEWDAIAAEIATERSTHRIH